MAQRQLRSHLQSQINEVKEMFNVPNVIGQHDAQAEAEGLEQCPFTDYRSFVTNIYQAQN